MSKLAYGPAANFGSKVLRGLTGASFGVGANNVPLVYNSFSTEVDNPEQRAYSAYAYNLPDGHPDKAKAQAMADSLPTLNPLRVQAQEELYDPWKFGERAGMGALEGFAGNELGQMFPGGIGGMFRRSSYQLPPDAAVAVRPQGPISPAPLGAAEELAAGKDEVLRRTSGPIGPASGQNLPLLGEPSDIAPVVPAKKVAASGPRNKPAGSKGSSAQSKGSSSSPPADTSAASGELKRFLTSKQAPTPGDTKATGGAVDGKGQGGKTFSGPLHAASGGRTDVLPIDVAAGSYVIPSDIVSALGEGNTLAGTKVIEHMFPDQAPNLKYASGGRVPIIAAGGEIVLSPEQVAAVGSGDLNHGHSILDAWVKTTRNDTINTFRDWWTSADAAAERPQCEYRQRTSTGTVSVCDDAMAVISCNWFGRGGRHARFPDNAGPEYLVSVGRSRTWRGEFVQSRRPRRVRHRRHRSALWECSILRSICRRNAWGHEPSRPDALD